MISFAASLKNAAHHGSSDLPLRQRAAAPPQHEPGEQRARPQACEHLKAARAVTKPSWRQRQQALLEQPFHIEGHGGFSGQIMPVL